MIRYRTPNRRRKSRLIMGMVTQTVRDSYSEPLLLSQDEVAHRLGISRTTLWRLIKQGDFETVHIGSRAFILADSVQDFIGRNTVRSENQANG